MVRYYDQARKKLAHATKFVPVQMDKREFEAFTPVSRLYKYHFIPQYVSPFILDSIPVYDSSILWVGEEVRAAELRGDLPDRSYSLYNDWLKGRVGKKLEKVYGWAYPEIRKKLRGFLLNILTTNGVEEEEEESYNGYIPGR